MPDSNIAALSELQAGGAAAPAFSDEALALRFAGERRDDLRYVAPWHRWMEWDGARWRRDDTLRAFDMARMTCRKAAAEANKKRSAIASAKTVAAVERLAKADRLLAASVGQWDADPWLLGTPGGTVDLRTGTLRPSDRADYITQLTATTPGEGCPRWSQFIGEITGGDCDIGGYLQRIAGYCMTGSTREEVVIFIYGEGGNGKGTFVETLLRVMGDYATTVAMSTLMMTKHQEHPTEIAKLRGVRLAVASETTEGGRWNMARIKLLSGGDRLTGRFMRADYFDFGPTHKLVVSGNRRPLLGTVDDAIRRRLHLVPFTVKIAEPDKNLKETLRAEWPGILTWMIAGCAEWQRLGLSPPAVVTRATEQYLRDQDDMQLWMDECCATDPNSKTPTAHLFQSWQDWAQRNGAWAGGIKEFSQRLEGRGFAPYKSHGTRMFKGIGFGVADDQREMDYHGADGVSLNEPF